MSWPAPAAALLLATLLVIVTPWLLRTLPEPPSATAVFKPPYRELATASFVTTVGLASLCSSLIVFNAFDHCHWLAWAALTGFGVLSCGIDARTTWMPLQLSWAGWALVGLGAVTASILHRSITPALSALLGALVVGGFFHLLWRFTGGFGYGDVRLAATIGAVTALESATLVGWSMLLGTLVGALWALGRRVAGNRGAFAYGPALLTGPFLAAAFGMV